MTKPSFERALAAVQRNLSHSPRTVMALALAAGMSAVAAQAHAGDFEYMGRTTGYELGRAIGGGGYGAGARVGGVIGQTLGVMVTQPIDQARIDEQRRQRDAQMKAQQQQQDTDRAVQQARVQAARDAAYDAERRRLDPNYVPNYQSSATRGDAAAAQYLGSAQVLADQLARRQNNIIQDYRMRNGLPPMQ